MEKKVAFYTLGCKLNQVDTEAVREAFARAGYAAVGFGEEADVYVVNTCTVTHKTEHQARQMLRRALRNREERPGVRVVAAGCYPQVNAGQLAEYLPDLDLIVGNAEKERIPELLDGLDAGPGAVSRIADISAQKLFRPRPIEKFSNYTRAFLRIQDGCNRRCAYCIVPFARGPSRSAPPETVIGQAETFARNGYREIVLVGIHIGRYGLDLDPPASLAEMIVKLYSIDGIERIRLSSIDPVEFTPGLFNAFRETAGKLCPHFHISLQSGDAGVLRRMKRAYSPDRFAEVAGTIREIFPGAAIGADVIVGFPGETEEAFGATRELVKRLELAYLHVFRYSKRPGTAAADMPDQVDEEVKKERAREMRAVRKALMENFRERFVGGELEVLLENRRTGRAKRLTGLSRNYIRVSGDGPDGLMGRIVTAKIAGRTAGGLEAEGFEETGF